MTAKLSPFELFKRLFKYLPHNVNQSSVIRLEQAEARWAITLETLRRNAAAPCYNLEYQFIPITTVEARVKNKRNAVGLPKSQVDQRSFMREEVVREARRKSGADRIREAFELSNFGLKLRCFNKRSIRRHLQKI